MPTPPPLLPILYEDLVRAALREDLGRAGDVTSDAIVPVDARAGGVIRTRGPGRVAGLDLAGLALRLLDPEASFRIRLSDGADAQAGATLAEVAGRARAVLAAERTALNFLGRLSGIATATRDLVAAVAGHRARVVCTRKTTPLLRAVEKHAVRLGGGWNHRFGLDDAVLVKDNHRSLAGGAAEAVRRVREHVGHLVKVQVEVEDLEDLEAVLALGVDAVLLDNMDLATLAEAVKLVGGRAITEASGGITPETAPGVAATGVDLISVGWLTHSAPCLDVGLDLARE